MTGERYTPSAAEPAPGAERSDLELYRERLRLFAARRLRDWAAAEDVAQEAIRRALEALRTGRLQNPAALPGFLMQTAVHICLHHNRSAGRERRALGRFADSPPQLEDHPLSGLISEERRAQVRQAFERLEEGDRQVLSLTYVESVKTAEIAKRLGLTEGNVRVRRHRALQRLAQILGVTRGADRGLKD